MCLLSLGCALSAFALVHGLLAQVPQSPEDGPVSYLQLLRFIHVVSVAFPIAMLVALAWVWTKLRSPIVYDEFDS